MQVKIAGRVQVIVQQTERMCAFRASLVQRTGQACVSPPGVSGKECARGVCRWLDLKGLAMSSKAQSPGGRIEGPRQRLTRL